jgi:hypothetical protein
MVAQAVAPEQWRQGRDAAFRNEARRSLRDLVRDAWRECCGGGALKPRPPISGWNSGHGTVRGLGERRACGDEFEAWET